MIAQTYSRVIPAPVRARIDSRVLITPRGVQIALGGFWLLAGLLQFQSYMYSSAFLTQVIEPSAAGSPSFIGGPILTFAHFYGHDLALWNTLAAELQCALGLGLILSKKTVRATLLVSFLWAFWVWWMGEGFATVFSPTPVSPLMGAPGAVLLYGLIGLLVWPTSREPECSAADAGPLGDRGGCVVWSLLWVEAAYLWLLHVDRTQNAVGDQLRMMASGSPHVLASWENSVAGVTQGHGEAIAIVLAIVSFGIAAGVWTRAREIVLLASILLSLAYWVLGQSLGGPFWIGSATDVNSGPLLVLLALALISQPRLKLRARREPASNVNRPQPAADG
jgi:hypothetical protein